MTPDPGSFAEALSEAIHRRGVTLGRIRSHLEKANVQVSIATLSYWQSGRSLPTRSRSYHTLVELERFLELEPGHLTEHAYTADGRIRRELFEWQKVIPDPEIVTDIIDDLGIDMQGQLTRTSTMDLLTIHPDRTEAFQECRTVWRAERQGLHRWAAVLSQDANDDAVPTIEPVFGCTLGRVVEVPQSNLVVAEMIALRPLQRGEVFHTEHRISFAPTTLPSFRLQRSLSDPVKSIGLGVRFDGDTVPALAHVGVQSDPSDEIGDTQPIPVSSQEAQNVWVDAKPGIYTLWWEWD